MRKKVKYTCSVCNMYKERVNSFTAVSRYLICVLTKLEATINLKLEYDLAKIKLIKKHLVLHV